MSDNESILSSSDVVSSPASLQSDSSDFVNINEPVGIEDASEQDSDEVVEDENLKTSLRDWQLRHRIPHVHCDALLKILKPYHPELLNCTRTLIGTSREKLNVLEMHRGSYFHI